MVTGVDARLYAPKEFDEAALTWLEDRGARMRAVRHRRALLPASGMKRVLFLVNGLGLGNATRCHAIMQKLGEAGVGCEVATSGKRPVHFRQQRDVGEPVGLKSLHYGTTHDRISVVRTILSTPEHIAAIRSNARLIETLMDSLKPDAVVTDSTYLPCRRHTPPGAVPGSE